MPRALIELGKPFDLPELVRAADLGANVLAELAANGVPTFVAGETYALDGTIYERRVGFIQDPEGNVIEYAEPLQIRS